MPFAPSECSPSDRNSGFCRWVPHRLYCARERGAYDCRPPENSELPRCGQRGKKHAGFCSQSFENIITMTVSRLLLQIASRMLYQHIYSLTVKRKEKEVTPLSFDVSVASQLTTQGDLELSSSTDSDASRILGLEFTSPRSTDAARERTHPGESGSWDDMSLPSLSPIPSKAGTPHETAHPGESSSWDDMSLPSLSPMPSKAGTPPISMQWSPTLSEKVVKQDHAPKAVSFIDIIETPLWRYADHKLKLDQIEFELSEPPRKRQKLASTPRERDLVGSLALSPGSFESVSLSDLTTDDPTESLRG